MDAETKIYMSFTIAIALFGLTWKYSPFNPAFVFYRGMVMGPEQMLTNFVAIVGVAIVVFIWIWVALVD